MDHRRSDSHLPRQVIDHVGFTYCGLHRFKIAYITLDAVELAVPVLAPKPGHIAFTAATGECVKDRNVMTVAQ